MKKGLLILFVLSACSSVKVSYDIDKTVDFTKIKTFAFTEETLKLGIQELNRNRIIAAVEAELAKRGVTKSTSPDALVDLSVKAEQKQDATATTTGGYGGGMYGGGYRYGYGGGFSTTQINYNEYIEGTLFVNLIQNDKLVWQGRGTKTLDEEASPERREKNITEAVGLIFSKYPVKPPAKK